jgi:hypothetical protein
MTTGRVRLYACIAAANHGTTIPGVLGESRHRPDVGARQEVMCRLYDDGFPLAQIGRFLNRDHSTVIHAVKKLRPRTESAPLPKKRERHRFSPTTQGRDSARPMVLESEERTYARIAAAPPAAPCWRCGARGECAHR